MTIRAISYGGGVQSTALLVLAAQGEIDARLAIFANVGEDSEGAETLRLVTEVYAPYAAAHGVEVVQVRRKLRNGTDAPGIRAWVSNDKRSVNIPVRMPGGAPGRRKCTDLYKRIPVSKELARRGATAANPATIVLGISFEEATRMRSDSGMPHVRHDPRETYPLVLATMDRADCRRIIAGASLPLPPKSSCTFCPFHDRGYWEGLFATNRPAFEREAAFEDAINANRAAIGRDPVFLHPSARPLREAVWDTGQTSMFEGASCDIGGYCHA